jgi:radial spoke head protein 4A
VPWLEAQAKALLPPKPKPEPVEGEEDAEPEEPVPDDPGTAGQISELLDDATLWESAGVGFGEVGTYLLFRSLQLLAGREGDECVVRFWGKILGRHGDYFIAQAKTETTSAPDPLEVNPDSEQKEGFQLKDIVKDFDAEGLDGPNRYTYWASSDPSSGGWTKLPHVTPAQIVAARAHRRFFTGDLSAPVPSFPPLPGNTEAHLLRATIADITADTTLSLAGLVEPDDDAAAEEPPLFKVKAVEADEDEGKTFTLPELRAPEAWLHAEIDIRPNGRCQVMAAPEEEESAGVDLEAAKAKFYAPFTAKDAPLDTDAKGCKPAARSIAEDTDAHGKSEWALRATPGGAAIAPAAALVIAKSLKWPGAIAVAAGFGTPTPSEKPRRRVTNVYVGYGVPRRAAGKPFALTLPPPVGVECALPADESADVVVEPPKPAEEE